MPVPSTRNKILPARGDFADLNSNVASLADGEICYAIDQDQYYQKEGTALVSVGATKAQGALADTAVQPNDNISDLNNDAGYITLADVAAASAVTSVNGQAGVVNLSATDVGAVPSTGGAFTGKVTSPSTASGDGGTTLATKDYVDAQVTSGSSQWTTTGSDIYYNTGNVGIGTSSPGRNLVVADTTNAVVAVEGSATGTSSLFLGDTDDEDAGSLVYNHVNNDLAITVNGSEAVRVDSSGRVGIGTTSPEDPLHIKSDSGAIRLENTVVANNDSTITYDNDTLAFWCDVNNVRGSSAITFNSDDQERMRIDDGGRLLVGSVSALDTTAGAITSNNSSSGGRLALGGNPSSAGSSVGEVFGYWNGNKVAGLIITSGADTTNKDDGELLFYTSASGPSLQERMRIDRSGNVGIGTTSPNFHLDVNGNVGLTEGQVLAWHDGSGSKAGDIYMDSSDNIVFRNTSSVSERMRIDGSGRLLIGATSAAHSGTIAQIQHIGSPVLSFARDDASISAGNGLGQIDFYGNDGGTYQECAKIIVQADGTHANNDKPSRMAFYTTASGGSSSTERMRIDSSGNVGIGTSSPQYKAQIFGGTDSQENVLFTVQSNGVSNSGNLKTTLRLANSTSGTSVHAADISAIRSTNAEALAFSVYNGGAAPVERMRIDSSGRIGIGTLSPSETLTLNTATGASLGFEYDGSEVGTINNNNAALYVQAASGKLLSLGAGGSEGMRLTSSRKLLIGHSSPLDIAGVQSNLEVIGQDAATASLGLRRDSVNASGPLILFGKSRDASKGGNDAVVDEDTLGLVLFCGADGSDVDNQAAEIKVKVDGTPANNSIPGALSFGTTAAGDTSPTTRMHISPSGLIGINETNPGHFLDMNIGTTDIGIKITSADPGAYMEFVDSNTTGQMLLGAVGNEFKIDTNGSESLRIDANGQLGLGTSTPFGSMHINGSTTSSLIRLTNSTTGAAVTNGSIFQTNNNELNINNLEAGPLILHTDDTERFRLGSDGKATFNSDNTSSADVAVSVKTGGVEKFRVMGDGDIENANGTYVQISDAKLKENIVDASSQWDDIKAIQIRNWNFKQETGYETHTQIGVIAQELETVSPGLVNESPDRDEEGNDLGTVTKSVKQSIIYMKAVKALQEAMQRIEELEARVADLEA